MPCVSKSRERLLDLDQAHVAHHAHPEARVQQVQDRVLDAADVLIDRHPVVRRARRPSPCRRRCRRSAGSTTTNRRTYPSCPSRAARRRRTSDTCTRRTTGVLLSGLPRAVRHQVFGQHDRQILVRHRHVAALRAVNERDRAAPVALARDTPVAQAPLHLLLAEALRLQVGRDRVDRRLVVEPVVLAGVDADAVLRVLRAPLAASRTLAGAILRADHQLDRQAVLEREARSRARRAPGTPITAPSP